MDFYELISDKIKIMKYSCPFCTNHKQILFRWNFNEILKFANPSIFVSQLFVNSTIARNFIQVKIK